MQKVHFIQQEARRQGKRTYRVDIDFKNAFYAMFQAALWQVMRMFKIPEASAEPPPSWNGFIDANLQHHTLHVLVAATQNGHRAGKPNATSEKLARYTSMAPVTREKGQPDLMRLRQKLHAMSLQRE